VEHDQPASEFKSSWSFLENLAANMGWSLRLDIDFIFRVRLRQPQWGSIFFPFHAG
jgi:hypothetical protein